MKARLTEEYVLNNSNANKEIFVHAFMKYKCERCGKEWNMYCEKGIEEFGKNHKSSPFTIICDVCGGFASDISGLIKLGGYYPLGDNMSYFANVKNKYCGVPILR